MSATFTNPFRGIISFVLVEHYFSWTQHSQIRLEVNIFFPSAEHFFYLGWTFSLEQNIYKSTDRYAKYQCMNDGVDYCRGKHHGLNIKIHTILFHSRRRKKKESVDYTNGQQSPYMQVHEIGRLAFTLLDGRNTNTNVLRWSTSSVYK